MIIIIVPLTHCGILRPYGDIDLVDEFILIFFHFHEESPAVEQAAYVQPI